MLTIEEWTVDRLLPYARNARIHPEEQLIELANSIREFGFNVPCLVDDQGCLIAGHGRLLAAKRVDMTTVPVIQARHLSPAQVKAYRLADNRIALNSEWDEELLAAELMELQGSFDLSALGFAEDELAELLNPGEGAQENEDDAPEPDQTAPPASQLGDVWLLGQHRVICGDSTDKATVAALLGADEPHLMVTDPPYGVEYDANWRNEAKRPNGSKLSVGAHAIGKVLNDDRADWREAWALFPGDVAYVWHAGLHTREVFGHLGRLWTLLGI